MTKHIHNLRRCALLQQCIINKCDNIFQSSLFTHLISCRYRHRSLQNLLRPWILRQLKRGRIIRNSSCNFSKSFSSSACAKGCVRDLYTTEANKCDEKNKNLEWGRKKKVFHLRRKTSVPSLFAAKIQRRGIQYTLSALLVLNPAQSKKGPILGTSRFF